MEEEQVRKVGRQKTEGRKAKGWTVDSREGREGIERGRRKERGGNKTEEEREITKK